VFEVASENGQWVNELRVEKRSTDAAVKRLRVSITSAASSLAYHVIAMIASGQVFGDLVTVCLTLCDTDTSALSAVAMEVVDLASGSVHGSPVVTSDPTQFFTGADVILLLDDVTAGDGEPRADWLRRVYSKFSGYGQQIDAQCCNDVLIILPAINSAVNIIGSVLERSAPNIPPANIVVTSRLAENRARAAIWRQSGVNSASIVDLIVWGDASAMHTSRFAVDVSHAKVYDCDSSAVCGPQYYRSVDDVVHDTKWLSRDLPTALIRSSSSSSSSSMSTASALTSFLSDWSSAKHNNKRLHSVAVASQGSVSIYAQYHFQDITGGSRGGSEVSK